MIQNSQVFLTGYKLFGGTFAPNTNTQMTRVLVQNGLFTRNPRIGRLKLDVIKAARVLVPSTGDTSPNHVVDYFKCYKVKISKGEPKFPKGATETVSDARGEARIFEIKKPMFLCMQADTNEHGIRNPGVQLMCYQVKPQSKFLPGPVLPVNDVFGTPGSVALSTRVSR